MSQSRTLHPATAAILKHFKFDHLPAELQVFSAQCHAIAWRMAERLDGPELTAGLRKLLEAKDCFVRAASEARTEERGGIPSTADPADVGAQPAAGPAAG